MNETKSLPSGLHSRDWGGRALSKQKHKHIVVREEAREGPRKAVQGAWKERRREWRLEPGHLAGSSSGETGGQQTLSWLRFSMNTQLPGGRGVEGDGAEAVWDDGGLRGRWAGWWERSP